MNWSLMMMILGLLLVLASIQRVSASSAQDPYQVLGLHPSATKEEVKRRFRILAKEWHPDKSDHPLAERKFAEFREAYDTLLNPQERLEYEENKRKNSNRYYHARNPNYGELEGFGLSKALFDTFVSNNPGDFYQQSNLWVIILYSHQHPAVAQLRLEWTAFTSVVNGIVKTAVVSRETDADLIQAMGIRVQRGYSIPPYLICVRNGQIVLRKVLPANVSSHSLVQLVSSTLFRLSPKILKSVSEIDWWKSLDANVIFVSSSREKPHLIEYHLAETFGSINFAHVYSPQGSELAQRVFNRDEILLPALYVSFNGHSKILYLDEISANVLEMENIFKRFENGLVQRLDGDSIWELCLNSEDSICIIGSKENIGTLEKLSLQVPATINEFNIQFVHVDFKRQASFLSYFEFSENSLLCLRGAVNEYSLLREYDSVNHAHSWIEDVVLGNIPIKHISGKGYTYPVSNRLEYRLLSDIGLLDIIRPLYSYIMLIIMIWFCYRNGPTVRVL